MVGGAFGVVVQVALAEVVVEKAGIDRGEGRGVAEKFLVDRGGRGRVAEKVPAARVDGGDVASVEVLREGILVGGAGVDVA
ncbi:hypothetical protein [Micromonospora sp. NPDC003241]